MDADEGPLLFHPELYVYIASLSLEAWRNMLAVPWFGRWSLTREGKIVGYKCFSSEELIEGVNGVTSYWTKGARRTIYFPDGRIERYWKVKNIKSQLGYDWVLHNHHEKKPAVTFAYGMKQWWNMGVCQSINFPSPTTVKTTEEMKKYKDILQQKRLRRLGRG